MRKFGFVMLSLSLLSAFTLGFSPAVAWADVGPKRAEKRQLEFEWMPAVPEGLTMRMGVHATPYLAQTADPPEASKTSGPSESETAPPARPRRRGEARPGDALYKAGMWMFIGGGSALVLGVTGLVAAIVVCSEVTTTLTCAGGAVVGILGVIFATIGGLVMVAGIPIWIVGATKRKQPVDTFKQDPYDPLQRRAAANRYRHLPPTQSVAGYTFSF